MGCFGSKSAVELPEFPERVPFPKFTDTDALLIKTTTRRVPLDSMKQQGEPHVVNAAYTLPTGCPGGLRDVRNISSIVSRTRLQATRCGPSSDIFEGVIKTNGKKVGCVLITLGSLMADESCRLPSKRCGSRMLSVCTLPETPWYGPASNGIPECGPLRHIRGLCRALATLKLTPCQASSTPGLRMAALTNS